MKSTWCAPYHNRGYLFRSLKGVILPGYVYICYEHHDTNEVYADPFQIILIQIAVPSRQDVEEYRCLRKVINEMVGRINGKFATIDYCPIHFVYNSLDFKEMVALYSVADICLVTSTRDGMNLVSPGEPVYYFLPISGLNTNTLKVSYEFIASQAEKKGTLILSEFTGAAQSLNGALIVNPWDAAEVAQAILEAVTMSEETRLKNYLMLSKYVNKFTAARWGLEFTNEIKNIRAHYKNLDCIVPTEEVCKRVKETPGRRVRRSSFTSHTDCC